MKQSFPRYWVSDNKGWWFMKNNKQMRWALRLPQLTALREYAGHGRRRERTIVEPGRLRPLNFAGQGNRRELHRELWRPAGIPNVFIWVLISACVLERYLRTKEQYKKVSSNNAWHHREWRVVSVPSSQTGEPPHSQGTEYSTYKGLASVVGNNWP